MTSSASMASVAPSPREASPPLGPPARMHALKWGPRDGAHRRPAWRARRLLPGEGPPKPNGSGAWDPRGSPSPAPPLRALPPSACACVVHSGLVVGVVTLRVVGRPHDLGRVHHQAGAASLHAAGQWGHGGGCQAGRAFAVTEGSCRHRGRGERRAPSRQGGLSCSGPGKGRKRYPACLGCRMPVGPSRVACL